jgi:magnesium-transporting ATPase (P-type)
VFSDKTGTLTQNKMEFARCSINGINYSSPATGELRDYLQSQNWTPKSEISDEDKEMTLPIVEYLRVLAICQNVVPEMKDGKCNTYVISDISPSYSDISSTVSR